MTLSKFLIYINSFKGTDKWVDEIHSAIRSLVDTITFDAAGVINLIDLISEFKSSYEDIYNDTNRIFSINGNDSIDVDILEYPDIKIRIIPNKASMGDVEYITINNGEIISKTNVPVIKDRNINTIIREELKLMLHALAAR